MSQGAPNSAATGVSDSILLNTIPVPVQLDTYVQETRPLFLPPLPKPQKVGRKGAAAHGEGSRPIVGGGAAAGKKSQRNSTAPRPVEIAILLCWALVRGGVGPQARQRDGSRASPTLYRSASPNREVADGGRTTTPIRSRSPSPIDRGSPTAAASPPMPEVNEEDEALGTLPHMTPMERHHQLCRRVSMCLHSGFNIAFPPEKIAEWTKQTLRTTPPRLELFSGILKPLLESEAVAAYLRYHCRIFVRGKALARAATESSPAGSPKGSPAAARGTLAEASLSLSLARSSTMSMEDVFRGAVAAKRLIKNTKRSEISRFVSELLWTSVTRQIDCEEVLIRGSRVDTAVHLHSTPIVYMPIDKLRMMGAMLSSISIRHCSLTTVAGLERCTSLVSLNLSNNRLRSLPFGLFRIESLRSIAVDSNFLDCFPEADSYEADVLGGRLEVLTASQNQIAEVPSYVSGFHNLQVLDLSFNALNSFHGDLVAGKPHLKYVSLVGNAIRNTRSVSRAMRALPGGKLVLPSADLVRHREGHRTGLKDSLVSPRTARTPHRAAQSGTTPNASLTSARSLVASPSGDMTSRSMTLGPMSKPRRWTVRRIAFLFFTIVSMWREMRRLACRRACIPVIDRSNEKWRREQMGEEMDPAQSGVAESPVFVLQRVNMAKSRRKSKGGIEPSGHTTSAMGKPFVRQAVEVLILPGGREGEQPVNALLANQLENPSVQLSGPQSLAEAITGERASRTMKRTTAAQRRQSMHISVSQLAMASPK